jgi:hypothetical protein
MRFISLLLASSLLLAGCDGGSNKSATATRSPLDRLEAALKISDARIRDSSLEKIAEDAYDAGDGEFDVVRKAIAKIDDAKLQSEVATKIALKLRDRGQLRMATEVAELVSDKNARDALLAKLAAP